MISDRTATRLDFGALVDNEYFRRAAMLSCLVIVVMVAWNSVNFLTAQHMSEDGDAYAASGLHLANGKVLYRDVWFHSAPGTHFLDAAAVALGKQPVLAIRAMERCFALATGMLMFAVVLLVFESALLALAGSLACLVLVYHAPTEGVLGLFQGGNYTEEYGIAFVLLGILAALLSTHTSGARSMLFAAISGFGFSCATHCKEPFLFAAIPWFLLTIFSRKEGWKKRILPAVCFVSGACIPFVLFASYLTLYNIWGEWFDVLAYNRSYAKSRAVGRNFLESAWLLAPQFGTQVFNVLKAAGVAAVAGLLSVVWRPFRKRRRGVPVAVVFAFLLAYWSSSLGGGGAGHYYIAAVPAFVLLAVSGLAFLDEVLKKKRFLRVAVPLVFLVLTLLYDRGVWASYREQLQQPFQQPPIGHIARFLIASTSLGDTLWTPNTTCRYYVESGMITTVKSLYLLPYRFIDTPRSTGSEKVAALNIALQKSPPTFIICARTVTANAYSIERMNMLKTIGADKWFAENYLPTKIAENKGPWGTDVLYVHKQRIPQAARPTRIMELPRD